MRWLQCMNFEISNWCNMAKEHPLCPIADPLRYDREHEFLPMSEDNICDAIMIMHEQFGFRGMVGFHFYNEPTTMWERMMSIIDRTHVIVPTCRFGLVTNGKLLTRAKADELSKFSQVKITNYLQEDWDWVRVRVEDLEIIQPGFDQRASLPQNQHDGACGRIFHEMAFDFYGNAHPCCMDWRREIFIGNYHNHPLKDIVFSFQQLRALVYPVMSPLAPRRCRFCFSRMNGEIGNIVPEIAAEALKEFSHRRVQ